MHYYSIKYFAHILVETKYSSEDFLFYVYRKFSIEIFNINTILNVHWGIIYSDGGGIEELASDGLSDSK